MGVIIIAFSDLMFWVTLPIFGGLVYWERHLVFTDSDRMIIQIFLLFITFAWVWFWYSVGINERIRQIKPRDIHALSETIQFEEPVDSQSISNVKNLLLSVHPVIMGACEEEKRKNGVPSH